MIESEKLVLQDGELKVTILQGLVSGEEWPLQPRELIDLRMELYEPRSLHSIYVEQNGNCVACRAVQAEGWATTVHAHSSLLHGELCLVATGVYVCALQLPSLDLVWATQTDPFTCFGIHHSLENQCYISHGELSIARLSYAGDVEWDQSGKDIFTGNLNLFPDRIEVTDWNDELYVFGFDGSPQ
ncbi:hypothetical protein EON80_22915 [bacterium]|nr:MAG: hypothetical protein EON80_22915 [bacterium]